MGGRGAGSKRGYNAVGGSGGAMSQSEKIKTQQELA